MGKETEERSREEMLDQPTQLYRHFNNDGELLYVGISLSAIGRLRQHRDAAPWFDAISRVEIVNYPTREEALRAEAEAIHRENPRHNIHRPVGPSEAQRAREARDRLTRQIAFRLIYTRKEAALQLGISGVMLGRLMNAGHIQYVTNAGERYVTGWQMIDYIERLELGLST